MKKAIVTAILLLLLVVGCASSGDVRPTEQRAPAEESAPLETAVPRVGVSWTEASNYLGETTTIHGPVVSTHWAQTSRGKPTFLNLGKPYPDSGRFTVVIWIGDRGSFPSPPEDLYNGKIIYVTGLVTEYEGIPQIEVESPAQISER